MKIQLFIITTVTGLLSSCSSINVTNNTGEDLSNVSIVYDYYNGLEIAKTLEQGRSVKTSKHMLLGKRHIRVVGYKEGGEVYEVSKELKPLTNLNVELDSKTVRK